MIRRTIRENGLVATLFFSEKKGCSPQPIVITLGGGSGGLSEFRAQLLAASGIPALSLAYFGLEGLPPRLEEIPLEYFEKTLDWLVSHLAIDSHRIGLWGVSRGAELSLLLASFFSEKIKAVAAYVPSSVIYGALIDPRKPAWIYRGNPLAPNAPFPIQDVYCQVNSGQAIALTPFFLKGMNDIEAFNASAIPVEKIHASLLLVSGGKDQMWPSSVFSSQIMARLKNYNSLIFREHYNYPMAGHLIAPCCDREVERRIPSLAAYQFDFGGNPTDDAKASKDAWEKTLHFFKTHLNRSE